MDKDRIIKNKAYESMRMETSASEKIKKGRRLAGLTQKQLADSSGLSIATIQGYEQGKYKPKYESLVKISQALGIPMVDFASSIFDYSEREIEESLANLEEENLLKPLLEAFHALNTAGKEKVIEYAIDLMGSDRYSSFMD